MLRRRLALSLPPVTSVARCGFVQGGPPPRKPAGAGGGDGNELYQVSRSHREEMSRRHREKMEAQERYYATQVDKPAPLPENAFIPGKFGMRRRLHRPWEDAIDLTKVSQAVDQGVNAMRK